LLLLQESVYQRGQQRRQEKLKRLARLNTQHCSFTPVYGPDLVQALTFTCDLPGNRGNHWRSSGHAHCQCVHTPHNASSPKIFCSQTSYLEEMVRTPLQHLAHLQDTLDKSVLGYTF
jgi:hypothetical protein